MFLGHVPSVLGQRFGNVEVSDKRPNGWPFNRPPNDVREREGLGKPHTS